MDVRDFCEAFSSSSETGVLVVGTLYQTQPIAAIVASNQTTQATTSAIAQDLIKLETSLLFEYTLLDLDGPTTSTGPEWGAALEMAEVLSSTCAFFSISSRIAFTGVDKKT